jgi:hypothetical protein
MLLSLSACSGAGAVAVALLSGFFATAMWVFVHATPPPDAVVRLFVRWARLNWEREPRGSLRVCCPASYSFRCTSTAADGPSKRLPSRKSHQPVGICATGRRHHRPACGSCDSSHRRGWLRVSSAHPPDSRDDATGARTDVDIQDHWTLPDARAISSIRPNAEPIGSWVLVHRSLPKPGLPSARPSVVDRPMVAFRAWSARRPRVRVLPDDVCRGLKLPNRKIRCEIRADFEIDRPLRTYRHYRQLRSVAPAVVWGRPMSEGGG